MPQNTKYKRLLLDRNIQQKDVSDKTGINKTMVNLITNGYSNITVKTLKKLVQFHRCSPNDILEWERWIAEAKKKEAKKAAS